MAILVSGPLWRVWICVLALAAPAGLCFSCSPDTVSKEQEQKIGTFVKDVLRENLEKDYRSHHIDIHIQVTGLSIVGIVKKQTAQDTVYDIQGTISYVIRGRRTWKDPDGNVIELAPEHEITHWFTCGVLEDRYLKTFFRDDRNPLILYADRPLRR